MRSWGRPPWHSLGIAAVAGLFLALGQAPFGAWFVALPALAVLLHRIGGAVDARAAAWTGWAGAAGYFALCLSWIVEPFLIDVARHGWMAPFAVVLMSGGLALFWAIAAGFGHRLGRSAGERTMIVALTLTLAELARGYVLTGFPWAMIGHIWIDTQVAQLAAIAGPVGLTFLACLVAALAAAGGWRGVAGGAVLLLAAFGYGQYRLSLPEPADRLITLRLIQPNAAQAKKWDPDQAEVIFRGLLAATSAEPRPDLVIWPETAVPYLFDAEGRIAQAIAAAAGGVPVVTGIQRLEGDLAYNSMVVIDPAAQVIATYDKAHLVPFGEYVPFGDLAWRWFGLRAFAAQTGFGYSAGPGPTILDLGLPLGKVLPLICYEAVFPQDLRAPERADWILQITNDAWFGKLTGPFQHMAQARLRAIEQGLPLIRVANTGITGVISARGQVVTVLPFGEAGHLDAALPSGLPQPPYARWGEAPILVLLAAFGLVILIRRLRRVD